jgi:hypothetical protein
MKADAFEAGSPFSAVIRANCFHIRSAFPMLKDARSDTTEPWLLALGTSSPWYEDAISPETARRNTKTGA